MSEDETIYNLIQFEKYEGKRPRYKSQHSPNVFPTGSTLGQQNNSAVVQNQQGSQKRPKLYHDRPKYKPTMGYTEKSNLRKSLDPKIFLRKGEGVSIAAEKTLFRIKKDTDTDISNKYGRYDKLPKLMKNRKDAHDKTQSNITGFNEVPMNKDLSKDSPLRKQKKKINNRVSQIARSVNLNPIQEEDEISKGPNSLNPGNMFSYGIPKQPSYMNPRKKQKPTPEAIEEQCMNTISSNSSQLPGTRFGKSRLNTGGATFENWLQNRHRKDMTENVMPEEEREIQREQLMVKHSILMLEYQRITHKAHLTPGLVEKKLDYEKRLNFIEESIKKLDTMMVYVMPTTA